MIVEDVGCAQDLASNKYPVECEVKNTQNQVPLLEGTQPYNGSDTVSRLGVTNSPLLFLKVHLSARAIIMSYGGGGIPPSAVLRFPRQPRHTRMFPPRNLQ